MIKYDLFIIYYELQISNYKEATRLGHQAIQDWLKKNGHDW